METEMQPVQVWYNSKDSALSLGGNLKIHSDPTTQQQLQRTNTKQCTPMLILKIALPVIAFLILAVPALTVFLARHVDKLSYYRQENTVLPDVANLSVTHVGDNYFTMSWTPPLVLFDYYWVESYIGDNTGDRDAQLRVGSCAHGVIIHRDQTQITCDKLKACANVSITVHTQVKGTSVITSPGATLAGIIRSGRDPDPPMNITIVQTSPSVTRIQWEPPLKVSGRIEAYNIMICETSTSCHNDDGISGCTERHTSATFLNLEFTGNSKLCAFVTSSAVCGAQVLKSRPAAVEITPASFVLPDVDNLKLVDLGPDYFTVSWERPLVEFDHYWVEVYETGDRSENLTPHYVGSCANGTMFHRDQTQITCDKFKACTNVSITVHTQGKSTSYVKSPGATLQGIFMPGKELPEVDNLTLTAMYKDSVDVSWQRPKGCFDDYMVEATEDKTGLRGGQELSAGSCGNETIVDATKTSITCNNIKACSVSITVRTRRTGPLALTSHGVTLHGIAMSNQELPEVANLTLTAMYKDSVDVSWQRPKGCFDDYMVEAIEDKTELRGHQKLSAGSCSRELVVDATKTTINCDNIEACSVSITVRTRRTGPLTLTSHGTTLRGIVMSKADLPEVANLTLTAKNKSSITVSWQRPKGCFDDFVVEVTEDKTGFSGGQKPSRSSCGHKTVLNSTETSITCDGIEACSVSITVRTRRTGPLTLTSHGVTLRGIVMSKAVLPEPHYTLQTRSNAFFLRWDRPPGCFNNYILEVAYDTDMCSGSGTLNVGSCAGTTVLASDKTSFSCSNTPPCAYANVTLRTQLDGPHGRTSTGHTTAAVLSEADLTGFIFDAGYLSETSCIIKIGMPKQGSCDRDDCEATVLGPGYKEKPPCYSNSNGCFLHIRNLRSKTSYTCFIKINHPTTKRPGLKKIEFMTS